jgi:trans-aconitate methyltransferase
LEDPGDATLKTVVIGIDADANMIQKASAQYCTSSPQLQFIQLDARKLGEEQVPIVSESKFDLIFSNAALHWIPRHDMDGVVQNIAQRMKPDTGRLVIEFGGQGNLHSIVTACYDVLRDQYGYTDHTIPEYPWYFPSIGEFTTLLERHGIDVQTADLYDRPTVLNDPVNGMKNWIQMFGQVFIEAAIQASRSSNDTIDEAMNTRDVDDNVQPQQALFLDAVNERLRPILFDGTQWIADYRRLRIVGRIRSNKKF